MNWAWRTDYALNEKALAAGCPASGWIHESDPPWRVLTAASRDMLEAAINLSGDSEHFQAVIYTGNEKTLDITEWFAQNHAKAEAAQQGRQS